MSFGFIFSDQNSQRGSKLSNLFLYDCQSKDCFMKPTHVTFKLLVIDHNQSPIMESIQLRKNAIKCPVEPFLPLMSEHIMFVACHYCPLTSRHSSNHLTSRRNCFVLTQHNQPPPPMLQDLLIIYMTYNNKSPKQECRAMKPWHSSSLMEQIGAFDFTNIPLLSFKCSIN